MVENPYAKMRADIRIVEVSDGVAPEDVDVRRLVISFVVDCEEVTINGEANVLHCWADMQTAPLNGDIVLRRAVGVDEDGYAIVKARAWHCHNWMWVYLERYPEATEENEADRFRDALRHIAIGNIAPSMFFAERILAGDSLEQAHAAAKARLGHGRGGPC